MAGPRAGAAASDADAAAASTSPTTGDSVVVSSRSASDTIELGERLGRAVEPGDLLCLWGELGAGKTQLTKGVARGLGIDDTVNSPTFVLMSEYAGRVRLFHVDLYRLADASDALAGGVVDERQADGVTVVEWPDRLRDVLPVSRLDVVIDGTGDEPRTIAIVARSPRYTRLLEAVR